MQLDGLQTILDKTVCFFWGSVCPQGVPQGSVLGPLSFNLNNIGVNIPCAGLPFYADDTVLYGSAPTPTGAFDHLKDVFLL